MPVLHNFNISFWISLLCFCKSETVVDNISTTITTGSGHIALNVEHKKSWAAVPYVRPIQTSFTNGWGTIALEANELDINQTDVQTEAYSEQV